MIAVRVVPPNCETSVRLTPMGGKFIVKAFYAEGRMRPNGYTAPSDGLSFIGIPDDDEPGYWGWRASSFRPLDDGDIQGLREKYGESVKQTRGRVVPESGEGK
jgi:hypothetical protein